MMKCGKKIWESLRASGQTGRRALAMLLSGAVLLCTLPVARISASAAEASNNPATVWEMSQRTTRLSQLISILVQTVFNTVLMRTRQWRLCLTT